MNRIWLLVCCCLAVLAPLHSFALDIEQHQKVQSLIDEMASEHRYDRVYLEQLFQRVELQPKVIKAINRPSERLPWHRYRKIFVTDSRINGGVEFWRKNEQTLRRAEQVYGVPAAVIVAIIGVETGYGHNLGGFAVVESLSTLSLQYPRRSKFFTSELKKFLLLVRDQRLDPFSVKGSYAGAIGIPQFMPSSYRAYAVDFSGNGKSDLVHSVVDAVGSVANYLNKHKWAKGGPIADDIDRPGRVPEQLKTKKYATVATVADLNKAGVSVDGGHGGNTKVSVVELELENKAFLNRAVFRNFYVVTKYNKSLLYAMAVYELSRNISGRRKNG